ncbi:MAG: MMPL family transporter [Actinomycetia bacterium]|nr:MMPL family transporter [Actinomycetes bacterium]
MTSPDTTGPLADTSATGPPIDGHTRGARFFEFVARHIKSIVVISAIASILLGLAGFAVRVIDKLENGPDQPAFDPGGEIYDLQDRARELFDPATDVLTSIFFVEAPDPLNGDVLTREALLEFVVNAQAVEADPESLQHLTSKFDNVLGVPVEGVFSIAHAVDEALPGGLASATDADVKRQLAEILDDSSELSTLRGTLSQLTTSAVEEIDGEPTTVWRSPAFQAQVAYLRESFEIEKPDADLEDFVEYQYGVEGEAWMRDVQDMLRGDQADMTVLGLAIDGITTEEEQSSAAMPFIMGAIVLIVLLVGALVRSYWASAIVAVGLSLTFVAYFGVTVFIGLKESILLTFIIPIAVLSFGVDFFIHGFGRCREEQADGRASSRAYPLGMTAVAGAVTLAVSTSVAAFLSNISSEIEAIQHFGLAAAVGLILAYLFLGVIAPKVVLDIEDRLGPAPRFKGPRIGAKLGFVAMSLIGGLTVTMNVAHILIGVVMLVFVFVPLAVVLPYRLVARRNRKAAADGRELAVATGSGGHGMRAAGSVVHFLARWRVVTVPIVLVLAGLGLYGYTQVEEKFSPSDFTSSDTDLIKSFNMLQTHYGASTGISAFLYVEGDLTDPDTLEAIEHYVDDVDEADAARVAAGQPPFLAREFDDTPAVASNVVTVVRAAMASPDAVTAIEQSSDISLDPGPNGLPTDAAQVAAIYDHVSDHGIAGPDGSLLWQPEDVAAAVHVGDGFQASRIEVGVATVSDLSVMLLARDNMETASVVFDSVTPDFSELGVTGEAVTEEDGLSAFTASMVLSLLIAFALCLAIAWAFMHSLRYALVSVVPILLVVGWVYGFMYLFGYAINPVTATIAAIAVGVGVDFAMHFTVRFREEFVGEPSRFPALRRAGEGTGGALVLSALTSMGGFLVMALAPMPIFADFGLLTAVMILFSLVVSLMVLPSLLLLVTPSRHGEERQELLDAVRTEHYDPHSRRTSLENAHH